MWPERFSPWRPVFFAAGLSVITLVEWSYELGTGQHPQFSVALLACWLPICFVFSVEEVARLRKQVKELERRLDECNLRPAQSQLP
jgi:hypothetical protein